MNDERWEVRGEVGGMEIVNLFITNLSVPILQRCTMR